MKDQPLFKQDDQVYEAIATERMIVSEEIDAVQKAIERKEVELALLKDRYEKLSVATKIMEEKAAKRKKARNGKEKKEKTKTG